MFAELNRPFLICYDGDTNPEGGDPPKVEFTEEQQKKFNEAMAKERRDTEARMAKQMEAEIRKQNEKHEAALQAALKNSQLSEEERNSLQEQLKTVQNQLIGKEEALKQEMKELEARYKTELETERKKAVEFETRYRTTIIDQALRSAADAGEAWNTQQVVELLRPKVKLEGEAILVALDDVREGKDGKKEPFQNPLPPADAIQRMKQLPTMYGNLFKSHVAPGIGGSGNADLNKPIDVRKMSVEEYARRREEVKQQLG